MCHDHCSLESHSALRVSADNGKGVDWYRIAQSRHQGAGTVEDHLPSKSSC